MRKVFKIMLVSIVSAAMVAGCQNGNSNSETEETVSESRGGYGSS